MTPPGPLKTIRAVVPSVAHAHRYPVLPTKVDRKSETFTSNRDAALTALAEIGAALAKANEGGGEKYTKRHVERGKILPRDRIELLLDRDSWFLEIGALAGYGMSGETPGTAVVGGIGKVSGVECLPCSACRAAVYSRRQSS